MKVNEQILRTEHDDVKIKKLGRQHSRFLDQRTLKDPRKKILKKQDLKFASAATGGTTRDARPPLTSVMIRVPLHHRLAPFHNSIP